MGKQNVLIKWVVSSPRLKSKVAKNVCGKGISKKLSTRAYVHDILMRTTISSTRENKVLLHFIYCKEKFPVLFSHMIFCVFDKNLAFYVAFFFIV